MQFGQIELYPQRLCAKVIFHQKGRFTKLRLMAGDGMCGS